ncbi:guanylate kinase [Candidatus Peregrinibacteria bacterium]|nr:MAG: guanylate kinase [Candidatus Peregrinibacteria bacterium]
MKGTLFLIVGPSGSGKSSVLMELKKSHPEYTYPLSATTRPMRPGEKEGDIYHFYSHDEFKQHVERGDFLEYAVVHQDHYYGLIKQPVIEALQRGEIVVREVDIQGFESIRNAISKEDLVTIFITAPNQEELIERIRGRAPIDDDELKKRLVSMRAELSKARECDYLVENKNGALADTVARVVKIIQETRS